MLKKILVSVALIFVGLIGGSLIGALTGGVGGGVIGVCVYNELALKSEAISEADSMKIAQLFAQKINERQEKLRWLVEHTEIEGADQCNVFLRRVKSELEKIDVMQ